MASLDHKQDAFGRIVQTDPDQQIYLAVFGRTFVIGAVVTLCALLIGYPLAYWVSTLPERRANLATILIVFSTYLLLALEWLRGRNSSR